MAKSPQVAFGKPSVHRATGQQGAHAIATIGTKYPRRYEFSTHGMEPQQVVDRVRAIDEQHAERETRLDSAQAIVGEVVDVNEEQFRISDAIIRDRGSNPELLIQFERLVDGAWRHAGRVTKVVASISAIPHNDDIVALVNERATAIVAAETAHDEFTAEVARLLGVEKG